MIVWLHVKNKKKRWANFEKTLILGNFGSVWVNLSWLILGETDFWADHQETLIFWIWKFWAILCSLYTVLGPTYILFLNHPDLSLKQNLDAFHHKKIILFQIFISKIIIFQISNVTFLKNRKQNNRKGLLTWFYFEKPIIALRHDNIIQEIEIELKWQQEFVKFKLFFLFHFLTLLQFYEIASFKKGYCDSYI